MNTYFYIASRLSKIRIRAEEKEKILTAFKQLRNNENEQELFFGYCKKYKLAPWIYTQILKHDFNEYLSINSINSFKSIYEKTKTENEKRNKEAIRFLRIFEKEHIDVAVLKGNLFIHRVYHDTGYKKMNDFDMLIRKEDWPKVQQIYFDLGYIPLGFGWTGEKQKAAKFSHAGMSFLSPDYSCITGTQWGLKSPTSKYKLKSEDIWENVLAFNFYNTKVKQLSPEYNLLHLVLHMGLYKIGIRDCMDVYNLLLSEVEFDEGKFVGICEKSNATDKAFFTLKLANYCSSSISRSLFEKLKPTKKTFIINRLNSRLKMIERGGDMHYSYNDYFHDVEMTVFYFSLYPQFHKKLKFYMLLVKQMFFPSKNMALKLGDCYKMSWFKRLLVRVSAPFIIFKLIGEEIGLGITIFLFLKLFVDLIGSVKNYFFRKESYFDYLKKIGKDSDEIKKVVKNIQ